MSDTTISSIHAARPVNPGSLTDRECQVMSRISQGYSNQEIAAELYLSINSVKTYIRTAYRRIEVTRRTQAVIWGVNHGLLDWDVEHATAG